MTKDITKGYSIWLIPDSEDGQGFQQNIQALANLFGSPLFSPHITLIGEVDLDLESLIDKFNQLQDTAEMQDLCTLSIDYHDTFFRSIVYQVAMSEALMNLNRTARRLFDRNSDPAYYPHLSLLYSNISENEKREAIQKLDPIETIAFQATEIHLIRTQGRVSDWELIQRVEL